jgi:hypothetical protein
MTAAPVGVGSVVQEPVDEALLLRHVGEKAGLHEAELHALVRLLGSLPRLELEREDLGEEVAGVPHPEPDLPRLGVVARDQAPELAVPQDRDRHRRRGSHIAHIFEMNRRDAAQERLAEIERLAGRRVRGRLDRDRRVAGVRDDPEAVAPIQLAGLGGNVRSGEPQVQVGRQAAVAILADHRAVPALVEPVDQHAIEPRQRAHVPGREMAERLDARGALQALHEGPQDRVGGGALLPRRDRLEFEQDQVPRPMRCDVEGPLAEGGGDPDRSQVAGPRLDRLPGEALRPGSERAREGREFGADQAGERAPQHGGNVPAGLRDPARRGVDGDQQAMRLDAAGDVDRLAVAIRERRSLERHATASSVSQSRMRSKVRSAAATMRSSAPGGEWAESRSRKVFHSAPMLRP